jgi:hypothetical protein
MCVFSRYTDSIGEIEKLRKEESKVARASKKNKTSPVMMEEESDNATLLATNSDDDESDEVQTWARGCLYCCEICNLDFVGLKAFEVHLATSHQMSQSSYKRKNGSSQSCVIAGFHFCRY